MDGLSPSTSGISSFNYTRNRAIILENLAPGHIGNVGHEDTVDVPKLQMLHVELRLESGC